MQKYARSNDEFCPVAKTLEMIGTPWKVMIVYRLLNGKLRFNEFKKEIPNISEKMLSCSLKDLEKDKIIIRTEYHDGPIRVEYELSTEGKQLKPLIDEMINFGNRYTNCKKN
ncbi:winged helix-turn-helix transcriptional regulator [Mesoplasma lactucae]|uniref:Transcriptional regulator n=1 Tax=Mesoplasma lactucae ATCC 49193 TaxID=81460 RepID=A0A291ISN1_9MOLU|nr:helix-turn-helix domain-containing protein [Mesoplasma lactucae]ATG97697.1 transcriptional regulator [Mesoplasma lactucae ATCC 49193]ATZ19837.1 transcriptional regulator [Mesoplasma lactucae ATCC 49193]MCL8216700.1 putative HTH-type transcriptional regulator YybR [Mesoplasma lactucae ATCC 49193]